MSRCENILYRMGDRALGAMAMMALVVTTFAVNRCCMWFLGQDEMPENAKKLRRF